MNFNVVSPESTEELLNIISKNQNNNFKFGAGFTDLIPEQKKQDEEDLIIINLARLDDDNFKSIKKNGNEFRIGALTTIAEIISNKELKTQFPVLNVSANTLASDQIRQVATIGGNLCTASPAGDVACALVALQANCELLSTDSNVRVIPISDFFINVKKSALQKDEVLQSITISVNEIGGKVYSDYVKIGTRRSMEIAIVSLAYLICTDENDIITNAKIAIGSVAQTIKFCNSACEYLAGKNFRMLSSSDKEEFASKVVSYASPITDIRGSDWYRNEVLFNISKGIFIN